MMEQIWSKLKQAHCAMGAVKHRARLIQIRNSKLQLDYLNRRGDSAKPSQPSLTAGLYMKSKVKMVGKSRESMKHVPRASPKQGSLFLESRKAKEMESRWERRGKMLSLPS